ncbi:hypothetical protein MVQ21_03005 [Fusobacterium necrophorum]|uniref:hypothetical protein n=1 Tax=Fusobacterium necrophorum TaxID=859 RepID=UPI0025517AAD|nr:hypothetical protein [Fusobacterium necrophorum]MDK4495277.1 hypothetical protein [Fusobacterium necrophorum]MDK4509330.1 hypothetical protein [Fusobacterium necrophorum]
MEKETVLEIEFIPVWDKWAWRIKKIELEAGEETNEIGEVFSTTIEKIDGVWRIGGNGNPTFYENMLITSEARHVLELIEKGINEKYARPKRWRAGYTEDYFYINIFGEIHKEVETREMTDEKLHKCGNYFQTHEQAEKARELQKKAYQEVWE